MTSSSSLTALLLWWFLLDVGVFRFSLVLALGDHAHDVLVVDVEWVVVVEEAKLRVVLLFRGDHDLHLRTLLADEGGRLLDDSVHLYGGRLYKIYNFNFKLTIV